MATSGTILSGRLHGTWERRSSEREQVRGGGVWLPSLSPIVERTYGSRASPPFIWSYPPPIPSPFSPTLFLRALFSLLSAAMFPSPPVPLTSRHSARKKFLKLSRSLLRLFQRNGRLNSIYYLL